VDRSTHCGRAWGCAVSGCNWPPALASEGERLQPSAAVGECDVMQWERSRHRPSLAYLARVSTARYYCHGDEREGEPGVYFCRRRDLFLGAAYFAEPLPPRNLGERPPTHGELLRDDERAFYSALAAGDLLPGTYRPRQAPNIVSGNNGPRQ